MMRKLAGLFLVGTLVFTVSAFAQDFSPITNILGAGVVTNQVLRLEFPRNDLSVQVEGTQLDPNVGVETELSFQQVTSQMIQAAQTGATAAATGNTATTQTVTSTGFAGRTTAMGTTGATGFAGRTTAMGTTAVTTTTGTTGTAGTMATGTVRNFATLQPGQVIVTGEICVTDTEEPKVIDQLQRDGLAITAVHAHFINASQDIRFIHVEGAGDGATLAQKLQNSLNIIGTPSATVNTGSTTGAQFADIMNALGVTGAKIEGNVIKFSPALLSSFKLGGVQLNSGMGSESEINFQVASASSAIVNAEIVVEASGADPVIQSLRSSGFSVAGLHNNTLDETPRLFYVHAFGSGSQTSLAQAISQALDADKGNLGARPDMGIASTGGTANSSMAATGTATRSRVTSTASR